jgi:hypothetical protein
MVHNASTKEVESVPSFEARLTDSTAITLLNDTANWNINGIYTGTTITNTIAGQYHRNNEYFFHAYDDNDWTRLPRA